MADWNERYKQGDHAIAEPHPLVVNTASKLTPGRALDIACGVGRHAIWLAERGWQVTAVDYSSAAIEILQQRSAEKGVRINACIADLERHEFVIQPESYDLIVICNYLQRDLFPAIKTGVSAGGIVVAIIPMPDDDPNVKPMNPTYLIAPGELRAVFEGWELIHDFEGKPGDSRRRATAEIVAVKKPRSRRKADPVA